jgi:3-hydroxyisobutyrate dehydrogenase-like beta-hydroxyacid dehydrogenase
MPEPAAGAVTSVGLVGLGRMGRPIAGHLLRAGFGLTVHDLDPQAVAGTVGAGAAAAGSPAELARASQVALVIVPSSEDVLQVCAGEAGLLAGAAPGTVVAVCSSVTPDTCRELERSGARAGVGVIDAALTRGVRHAEEGDLTLLVGGDPAHLERARPVLEAFSGAIHHLGPVGAGQVGKTVHNLVHWAEIAAITEALALGQRLGVPVTRLRSALMDAGVGSRTLRELHLMRFTWWRKDIADATAIAGQAGQSLPLTSVVSKLMQDVTVDRVHALLTDQGW